ncbi:MAG: hypothetical protein EOP04_02655 [Proteobacteria bacterium]|nr:MAG: hypothetical protein EOP04_02655 [Pseudomonadota bacterium]
MKVTTLILSSLLATTVNCNNEKQKVKSQLDIARSVYDAVYQFDTVKLYSLVDTAHCFSIYGRDGFLHQARLASEHIRKCKGPLEQNEIRILRGGDFTTNIIFPICPTEYIDNVDSMNMIIGFADFQKNKSKAFYFDLDVFKQKIRRITLQD